MKTACHYAIVRFMPFVETGEFANVGVVLFAPNARYFGFKLLGNRYARVTHFFEQMDTKVFLAAMKTCKEELVRIDRMLKQMGTDLRFKALDRENALALWNEMIKPRETMLQFSESRLVLTDNAKTKVMELFRYYVERNFVTLERQEQLLEKEVRSWLRNAELKKHFCSARVGNEDYHAQFPFVFHSAEGHPERIIKPLNLDYDDAARIIDHGGQWIVRINALKKRNLLPNKVLFAVKGPDDLTARGKANRDVVDELNDTGVTVVTYGNPQPIIEFAK